MLLYNKMMGDRVATYEQVCKAPVAEKTKTYEPLPNKVFIDMIQPVVPPVRWRVLGVL